MGGGKRRFEERWASDAQDKTIIDQIMLRFRPIAPKPARTDGTVSVCLSPAQKKDLVMKKRAKRKYVRVNKKKAACNFLKNNNEAEGPEGRLDGAVTLLQLQTVPKITINPPPVADPVQQLESWINFSISGKKDAMGLITQSDLHESDPTATMAQRMVVESWVTMECVTGPCEDGGRLGRTDEDKIKNLGVDTCPGFISNGLDAVQWVNQSYRRMVDPQNGGGAAAEVVARLVVKDKFPLQWPAFSCRVRVVHTGSNSQSQMTVPCDVWKMEFGGFAWRLDMEAALCLGR